MIILLLMGIFNRGYEIHDVDTIVFNEARIENISTINQLVILDDKGFSDGYIHLSDNPREKFFIDKISNRLYVGKYVFKFKYYQEKVTNYDYDNKRRKKGVVVKYHVHL